MEYLVLISCIFILANALPVPQSAYQYSAPENSNVSSYAAPLGSVGPLPTIKTVNASKSSPPPAKNSSDSHSGSNSTTIKPTATSRSIAYTTMQSSPPTPDHLFNQTISKFGGIIHKHVYVNLPPPEIEVDHRAKVQVKLPPPQRNYKIVFIKAPSVPVPSLPDIPQLRQDEEKTLVYVLSKNLDEQLNIVIPTAAPTQPSRPEVHFVNYKLLKEKSGGKGTGKENVSNIYGPSKSTGHNGTTEHVSKKSASKSSGGY